MSTATLVATDTDTYQRIAWQCGMPTVWPKPEGMTNEQTPRSGGYTPDCNKRFATEAERTAHQEACHPEYLAERRNAKPRELFTSAAQVEVVPDPGEGGWHGESRGRKDSAVTEAQLGFIKSLGIRKGVTPNEVKTKKEASTEIGRLKALPDSTFRRNSYDGRCATCNTDVPAGEGMILKDAETGRWLTYHLSCPDVTNETPDIPKGRYAVTSEAGHTSFYRVTPGRNPGVVFVDLLVGGGVAGGFEKRSLPRASRDAVLAKIAEAGPREAALRFGRETGICCMCGRGLTDEVSREAGIGPECAKK